MHSDLATTSAARTGGRGRSAASQPPAALETLFHPAVANWFADSFAAPTAAQAEAWPAIKAGRHTLIAAPTGSGKTLAAFLAAIDDLVRRGLEGPLPDATQVVYVSPLKALSNDIHRNLEAPLAGIREQLRRSGLPDVEIRTWVRTGDTPPAERDRMRRRPPHILVTTPESLYVLLGSESGRAMLGNARSVIVDEIHAVAPEQTRRPSRSCRWRGWRRSAATACSGSASRPRKIRFVPSHISSLARPPMASPPRRSRSSTRGISAGAI